MAGWNVRSIKQTLRFFQSSHSSNLPAFQSSKNPADSANNNRSKVYMSGGPIPVRYHSTRQRDEDCEMTRSTAKPTPTLTEMVSGKITERIGKGELKPGDCVPSERALSRSLRVSRITARNGLNHLVRSGLLRREPGRGYFVRSRNGMAANQAAGSALVFVHG